MTVKDIQSVITVKDLPAPPVGKRGWPWTVGSRPLPLRRADGSEWPRLSIVTPSYNQGRFLEMTIRSVLLQGYPNLEYVVIDGGSSDESVEVLKKYDAFIKYWVSEPDQGQTDAVNKGLKITTGSLLGWINSDDVYTRDAIRKVVDAFTNNPKSSVVHGSRILIDENNWVFGCSPIPDFNPPHTPFVVTTETTFWRKSEMEKVGFLNVDFRFAMDLEFISRIYCNNSSFVRIDDYLGYFRCHSDAKSSTISHVGAEESSTVWSQLFNSDYPFNYPRTEKSLILREFIKHPIVIGIPYFLNKARKALIMKILLTLHHYLDPNAGAASVTLKLGEAYEELGHSVYFYSFDNIPKRLQNRLSGVLFPVFVAWHIILLSRRVGLDVVQASSVDAWFWGFMLRKFSFGHGLEHTMHERILEEAKNGTLKLSWKYPLYNGSVLLWKAATSFRVADFCFMLNRYDADIMRGRLGVAAERVRLVPNGIPDEFIGLPFERLGEDEVPGVAFVGSYLERKGIKYGVPALDAVMQRNQELRAIFLGTGCSVDRVLSDFSLEVRERVRVVPSFAKLDLPGLLRGYHIMLFPSLSEGFPLALPEAMACGLAPIATDIPGPTEIVNHEENGLLVKAGDQLQLEQAIERLLSNMSELEQLRVNAHQTVQSYSWASISGSHLHLYSSSRSSTLSSEQSAKSLLI
jgi:glycosyltransferase involved in cell wall biosynthesis